MKNPPGGGEDDPQVASPNVPRETLGEVTETARRSCPAPGVGAYLPIAAFSSAVLSMFSQGNSLRPK
jgi:hypothetical protein